MYKSFFTYTCLFLFLLTQNVFSQDPPIDWEEIPLTDLQMTSFPRDSNASAVILCDYGETKLNDDMDLIYTRHFRVKILNENGYDWGTHSIYLYTGENGERLNELEAITYSLSENGDIIETELDDDEIFEEEVMEDHVKYNFTMPALKPGCIIEIRYKIVAESLWFVRGWTFQKDEPVLWSEYRIKYPQNISFAAVSTGYEPWALNEHTEVTQIFRGTAAVYLGNIANCHQYQWAIKNAPALRDEPYITTSDDYVNRVDIQLAGYNFYQTGARKVLQDWKTLSNELLDLKSFGDMIDETGDVEELTLSLTKDLTSSFEKMRSIYSWITKSIVWTGENDIYADYDADEVIEYKKGNNAEITFLLLSMLKSAGLSCDPVILSTRSNGKVQELYPIVSQFNYVLARAHIGSQVYFLDATDPSRTYDLLPEKVLNVKGFVIKKDKPEWVFLASAKNNLNKSIINVKINEDGSLSADFEEMYGEYKSLSVRKDLNNKIESDIAKDLFDTESSGFTLDSVKVFEKDSISVPFRIKAWITSSNYTQQGGDFLYFNPTMIHRLTDNPFKARERKFPIDYGYPRGQLIITNIIVPDGYEIKEKYSNKSINVGNSASFKRVVEINENHLQIMSRMDIKESEIKPKYYKELKDFYSNVVQAQSEMIVLGKREIPLNIPESIETKTETNNE